MVSQKQKFEENGAAVQIWKEQVREARRGGDEREGERGMSGLLENRKKMRGGDTCKTAFLWPFWNSAVLEASAPINTSISFPGQIWIQPSVDVCLHSQTFFGWLIFKISIWFYSRRKDENKLSIFFFLPKM